MSTEANETARTAALKFADALASSYRAQLGERLIGAYVIGSLAHGGFSHRYSDIDVALITEFALDTTTLTTLHGLAPECDATLSQKLSVFWSDRGFTAGRRISRSCTRADRARAGSASTSDTRRDSRLFERRSICELDRECAPLRRNECARARRPQTFYPNAALSCTTGL